MGRKVHPAGFRVGIVRDWQAKWYADKNYVRFLQEDLKLRQAIRLRYADAGISLVEIDRQGDKILMNIHTARPGVVIGRGGQRVDEMRQYLENLVGNRIQLNILEVRQPELDAYLVAVTVAEQIQRRIAYRRAMKQAMARTIEAGAKGMRISCSGRLAGTEIARREMLHQGQVPLHKLRADIDYGFTEAHTTLGRIGVKVWIYKGDILPEAIVEEAEEIPEADILEEAAPVAEEVEKKPVRRKKAEAKEAAPEAAAPVAEEVEKKPVRRKKAEAKEAAPEAAAPVAEEVEKKPVRRTKAEAKEAAPEAAAPVVEEVAKKPVRREKAEVKEAAPEAAVPVVEEVEKKPVRRKKTEAKEAAPEAAAPVVEGVAKKPVRRKKAEAKEVAPEAAAPVVEEVEKKPVRLKKTGAKKATPTELEETNATTEPG